MKKVLNTFMFLSILLSGCSREIVKYDSETETDFLGRINKICKEQEKVTVEMRNGEKVVGKFYEINTDSVSLGSDESKDFRYLKRKEINSISFSEVGNFKTKGMFSGLWVGLGLAALNHLTFMLPVDIIIGYICAPLIGGGIGIIYGNTAEHQTIIKFN